MRLPWAHLALAVAASSVVAMSGCKDDEKKVGELVSKTIGPDGGIITSADGVLTIALRAGALDEPTEVSIQQRDDPPPVYGPAYRVKPDIDLAIAASVSYHYELPTNTDGVTVGAILKEDFEAGEGMWIPLPLASIEVEDELVRSTDMRLSMYYALLDEGGGAPSDTGDTTGGMSGSGGSDESTGTTTVDPTTGGMTSASTTNTTTGTDTGGTDTGVMYPPECDNLFMGPYTVLHATGMPLFAAGGSEDFAMSGNGTFVGLDGTDLVEIDQNAQGTTWATNVPTPILGARFTADNELLIATPSQGSIQVITQGGSAALFTDGFSMPNGIYPDGDGNVWVTDLAANEVIRISPDRTRTTIANATQPNGIVYDDLRRMLFWSTYADSQLWRAPIDQNGMPGTPVMVTDLDGTSDGITLDVCGNVYVVDHNNGGSSRLDRVFLDENAQVDGGIEEIANETQLQSNCANAQFGYGFTMYEESIYLVGEPGNVYLIDLQIQGHPIAPLQ